MLFKSQSECFPRNCLFENQFLQGLRDSCRTNHLVLDSVAEITHFDVKGYPTEDVFQSCFSEDIGDAVAHAEVGTDSSVKNCFCFSVLKNRENVGRCTADIDPDDCDVLLGSDSLDDLADCPRRRHNGGIRPINEFSVAGRVCHDVFEELILNLMASWHEVFTFQNRTEVVYHLQCHYILQSLLNRFACVCVSGIDKREFIGDAQPRSGTCGGDNLC